MPAAEGDLKNTREPSVSHGGPFSRPSLVSWTVAVICGGGSGRVTQNRVATATATIPAADAAHFSRDRRLGAAAGTGKDGEHA